MSRLFTRKMGEDWLEAQKVDGISSKIVIVTFSCLIGRKNLCGGDYLGSMEGIKAESARTSRSFSKTDFQKCFQSWER